MKGVGGGLGGGSGGRYVEKQQHSWRIDGKKTGLDKVFCDRHLRE